MRKLMIFTVALLVLSVPCVASAKKPVVVRAGNLIIRINGDVFRSLCRKTNRPR